MSILRIILGKIAFPVYQKCSVTQNACPAGAPLWTTLGELTMLPQTLWSAREKKTKTLLRLHLTQHLLAMLSVAYPWDSCVFVIVV